MSRGWVIASVLGAASLGLIILYFTWAGLEFWRHNSSLSWQQCMYGKAECSIAAATWFLTLVGVLAFVVAVATVFYASQAFGIETVSRLGQSECSHHDPHQHPADKHYFITHAGDILPDQPAGVMQSDVANLFEPHHNAFVVLGRTSLAGVRVLMHARGTEPSWYRPYWLAIGNIRRDQEVHVTVYVAKTLGETDLYWSSATERGRSIEFDPEQPFDVTASRPFRLDPEIMRVTAEARRRRQRRETYLQRLRRAASEAARDDAPSERD